MQRELESIFQQRADHDIEFLWLDLTSGSVGLSSDIGL
jgi:hypothetical protein